MQNHFARSSGNGWKRAFSSIVAVLLFCSGLRAQEACPVEIKLLISAPPVKSVIASLGLGNETAGQVYFFDTDNLDLFKQGVILRVRQGTQNDLTVKVRLSDSTQIDRSKLQGHFGCEVDRIGAEAITSFSVGRKYKLQPLPVAGEDILSALSSRQRSLLQEAQVSIDWSMVKRIAGINSKQWTAASQSRLPGLTLEYWEWPAGNILELSTRATPNQSESKSADLQKIVKENGLLLSADQGTKTGMVLKSLMPPPGTQSQTASHAANPLTTGVVFVQLLERKSLVFPDLATSRGPLNSWGKFKLAANNSISLSAIGSSLLGGAYGQMIDSPSGYGQGGSGYAKRFGSGMARSASDNLFGTFLIASVMHEDPRFYVQKGLSFKQAVKYSAVRLVQTRSDSGRPVVNYDGLLGPLAAEALANTYWPEQNRGVGSTMVRYAGDIGWKFGGNLLRQYWPQINRKLRLAPPPTD